MDFFLFLLTFSHLLIFSLPISDNELKNQKLVESTTQLDHKRAIVFFRARNKVWATRQTQKNGVIFFIVRIRERGVLCISVYMVKKTKRGLLFYGLVIAILEKAIWYIKVILCHHFPEKIWYKGYFFDLYPFFLDTEINVPKK